MREKRVANIAKSLHETGFRNRDYTI